MNLEKEPKQESKDDEYITVILFTGYAIVYAILTCCPRIVPYGFPVFILAWFGVGVLFIGLGILFWVVGCFIVVINDLFNKKK